jgi:SNF2 family DNA or RNA helicase
MWTKLFYDKYATHHHPKNPITSKVTIEDLEDGTFEYYTGNQAFEVYNSIFTEYFQIPDFAMQIDFLRLDLYIKQDTGIQSVYTIFAINHEKLEEYVRNDVEIPNEKFLKSLFRFHLEYDGKTKSENDLYFYTSSKNRDELIDKNIDYVVEKSMEPVDYTMDERIPKQKDISIELYDYQRCSVNWMIETEQNLKNISFNMNQEIKIGSVYYDMLKNKFYFEKDRKKITFYGGGLIDEVGLGKTIEMITLAINNPPTETKYYDSANPTILESKATLVLCPNQLCGQWIREIENKVSKNYNPSVVQLLTKRDFDKYTYQDLLDADFVIVSFTFLDNKCFTTPWASQVSAIKNFHKQKWSANDVALVSQLFTTMGKKLVTNIADTLGQTGTLIQLIKWHRIAVDEIHEIYSNFKYGYLDNIVKHLKSTYRWAISATPYIGDSKVALTYLINFLSDFKNEDGIDVLTQNEFIEYLSNDCFRRNTKKSVKEEHTLPPIKEEIRWLKFTATERMMYNAHTANENNDKFSTYLRQLCCHPQLADETKHCLSNCKTLQDIEKEMVHHYKMEVDTCQEKLDKTNERLNKLNKKIRKIEKKQRKKQAKKLGLKVESSDSESDDDDDDDDDEIAILIAGIKSNGGVEGNIPPSITLMNLKESVQIIEDKKKIIENELNGKKTTMDFFNNVVNRVKKTIEKESILKKDDTCEKERSSMTSMQFLMSQFSDSDESDKEEEKQEDDEKCGICLCDIPEDDVGVTKCGHIFCYKCIKISTAKNHTCPYCRGSLKDNEFYIMSYEKPKKLEEKKQIDMEKDELINVVGTKLANLIYYLKETDEHTIIFSQWDDLLRRVGNILKENGIKNVFCKGNVYQRDKAIREFNEDDKVKVIMLSSEKTASGTNLTKASQVIIIEPIYGSYKFRKDQERQAVGRAHRLGQKKNLKLVRFLVRKSVEEDIHNMNLVEDGQHVDGKDSEQLDEMEIC